MESDQSGCRIEEAKEAERWLGPLYLGGHCEALTQGPGLQGAHSLLGEDDVYTPNMRMGVVGTGTDTLAFSGDEVMEGCMEEGTSLLNLSEQVSAGQEGSQVEGTARASAEGLEEAWRAGGGQGVGFGLSTWCESRDQGGTRGKLQGPNLGRPHESR